MSTAADGVRQGRSFHGDHFAKCTRLDTCLAFDCAGPVDPRPGGSLDCRLLAAASAYGENGNKLAFDVRVIDGEGLPVPSIEVGARCRYEGCAGTWGAVSADGGGHASFRDDHPEPPVGVALFVDDGAHVTIEM